MSKLFFSMIDCLYPIPGAKQHTLIGSFAHRNEFLIGFYGAEDPEFMSGSPYLMSKLDSLVEKYQGIVFFDLFQIRGDAEKVINAILFRNLEVAFAIQELIIKDHFELQDHKVLLSSSITSYSNRGNVLNKLGLSLDQELKPR